MKALGGGSKIFLIFSINTCDRIKKIKGKQKKRRLER